MIEAAERGPFRGVVFLGRDPGWTWRAIVSHVVLIRYRLAALAVGPAEIRKVGMSRALKPARSLSSGQLQSAMHGGLGQTKEAGIAETICGQMPCPIFTHVGMDTESCGRDSLLA